MTNATEKIKNLARNLATAMIDGESREWPPECPFVLYQPKRPNNGVDTEKAVASE